MVEWTPLPAGGRGLGGGGGVRCLLSRRVLGVGEVGFNCQHSKTHTFLAFFFSSCTASWRASFSFSAWFSVLCASMSFLW